MARSWSASARRGRSLAARRAAEAPAAAGADHARRDHERDLRAGGGPAVDDLIARFRALLAFRDKPLSVAKMNVLRSGSEPPKSFLKLRIPSTPRSSPRSNAPARPAPGGARRHPGDAAAVPPRRRTPRSRRRDPRPRDHPADPGPRANRGGRRLDVRASRATRRSSSGCGPSSRRAARTTSTPCSTRRFAFARPSR